MRCLWVLVGVLGPWGIAGAQQATITALMRVVEHRRAGTTQWLSSRVGTVLAQGDRVRTGPRSYAEITFADKTVMKLNERSELTINAVAPRQQDVEVHQGSLWARFVKGSRATVRGKTVVAAVRGTVLLLSIGADGTVTVRVWEGELTVTLPNGEEIVVRTGQELAVPPTLLLTPQIRSAPPEEFGSDPGPAGSDSSFVDWLVSGVNTSVLPGASDFGALLENNAEFFSTVAPFPLPGAPSLPPPGTGTVEVIVRQAILEGAALGLVADRRPHRLLGVRIRPRTSIGPLFASVSVLPLTDTAGNTRTRLAEVVVTYRRGDVALRIGRQWLSGGPVLGNAATPDPAFRGLPQLGPVSVGKLVLSDIADAAALHLPVGRGRLTLAYLQDALPFLKGEQQGGYARLSAPIGQGVLGLSALKVRQGTVGYALDASVPVIPNELDLYGEVGRHSLFRSNFYTVGVYLAGLFRRWGTDLFVEYTKAPRSVPNMVTVRLYQSVLPSLRLALIASRRGDIGRLEGGTDLSVGLIYSTSIGLR